MAKQINFAAFQKFISNYSFFNLFQSVIFIFSMIVISLLAYNILLFYTISIEKVKERIDNQWSDKKKAKLSDYVIHNLDLEKTSFLVAEIHKQLLKLSSFTY